MATQSVINDDNYEAFLKPIINNKRYSTGLKPRDYASHPEGCFAWADPFPDELLIPEDEIDGRLKEQAAQKASLLDWRTFYYSYLQSLDQDGLGLCWAFSSTKAMMYLRALEGEAMKVLSAWWVAGKVKNWRDEGGWGGESLAQIVSGGVPEMSLCPSYKREYDTPATQANATLHKCVRWWEGSQDRDKATHQMFSAWCWSLPTINDYNWWSHSVCGIAGVSYKGGLKGKIDNSWGEKAGDKGIFQLEGEKAKPDGLWIAYVQQPSVQ